MDALANCRSDGKRIALRAHHQMSVFSGHHFLGVRNIELRVRALPQRAMLYALDHADYGPPIGRRRMIRSRDAFSNRIFARPVAPGQLVAAHPHRPPTLSLPLVAL